MLLIIGSNGLLGRHAAAHFAAAGTRVVRASHLAGAALRVNLRHSITSQLNTLSNGITHALLCSGITNLDACVHDPAETRLFNVTHSIDLLREFLRRDIQPIFCSSDLVFEGDRGDYAEHDARYPTTEYGRQKMEVEDFLLDQGAPCLIIRMSKLYSLAAEDPSPIGDIMKALHQGGTIRAAGDQVICPTWFGDIPRALDALLSLQLTGVFHLAAPQRFTRHTLALRLARALGREELVRHCSIRDFAFAEPRPPDTSLDARKFLGAVPFTFQSLEASLPKILESWGRPSPHSNEAHAARRLQIDCTR